MNMNDWSTTGLDGGITITRPISAGTWYTVSGYTVPASTYTVAASTYKYYLPGYVYTTSASTTSTYTVCWVDSPTIPPSCEAEVEGLIYFEE